MRSSAEHNGHRAIRLRDRIGAFRYHRADDRWEWSDAVAHMHGYPPGVQPTTAQVLSHKHPDDAAEARKLIDAMAGNGRSFNSTHRIIDKAGRVRSVLVVSEQLRDAGGDVVGSEGFYIDLSDLGQDPRVDAAVAEFTERRSDIEQAKGILMAVYGIPAERAFDILVWRSQETNTKLRKLVQQIIVDFTGNIEIPNAIRERADHLLLTAHKRVNEPLAERTSK